VRSIFSNVGAGQVWSTGQDYKVNTPGTGTPEDLAAVVNTAWVAWFATIVLGTTAISSYMKDAVKLVELQVYDLGASGAVYGVAGATGAKGVNSTNTALPPDLATVISKRTGQRGAKGRGRCYISGWSSNALSTDMAGYIHTSLAAAIASGYSTQFKTLGGTGATYKAGVVSQAPSIGLDKFYEILSFQADNHWDVQRRRGQR